MAVIVDAAALSARVSDKTIWTFVRLTSDSGHVGWGEATLKDSAAEVHAHVREWAGKLVGLRLSSPAEVTDRLAIRGRRPAAAASAIDQALWDVIAQERGEALFRALDEPQRSTIDLYANINRGTRDRSPAGFGTRAKEVVARGFAAVKIAPFDEVRSDCDDKAELSKAVKAGLERITAVRAAIGPEPRLLVDCHWRLSEVLAGDILRETESLKLYWLECPISEDASNLDALRRLPSTANTRGVRLAGCEMMTGVDGFRPFIDAGSYDVIMPDVKYAGGLREFGRIAAAAARRDIACSPHNPSGPIAHVHSLHVSALLPMFPFLELQYGESPLFFEFVEGVLPDPRSGSSPLPQGAGLGVGIGGSAFHERLITFEDGAVLRQAAK